MHQTTVQERAKAKSLGPGAVDWDWGLGPGTQAWARGPNLVPGPCALGLAPAQAWACGQVPGPAAQWEPGSRCPDTGPGPSPAEDQNHDLSQAQDHAHAQGQAQDQDQDQHQDQHQAQAKDRVQDQNQDQDKNQA